MAKKTKYASIGERIRYVRGHLTTPEFGKKVGFTRNTISYWEHNVRMPVCAALIQMNKKFGVNINWLLTGKGDPYLREIDNIVLNMDSRLSILEKKVSKLEKRKKA